MDLEQLEALALSGDRAAALAGLLPGTVLHDYWRGVHLQAEGKLDEVDAILSAWWGRHREQGELHARLSRRQLLLRAGADLATHAEALRFEAGISLDDQAEAVAAAQRYPSRLDPALVDGAALVEDGLRRASDLGYLTDWVLPDLVTRSLDATGRRELVRRLPRANVPGVVELVAAVLAEPSPPSFGSMSIRLLLTLAQLVELAGMRPAMCQDGAWVDAVLQRLLPPAHVDVRTDLAARREHLDKLWTFVSELAPSFNWLKALVLHHRLDLDRRLGAYDRARFLRYLELPRQGAYVDPDWLRRFPSAEIARSGQGAAGLDPIGDDEPLVREYLHHFLEREDVDAFADKIRRDWLQTELATARLSAGDPDAARWTGMLSESAVAALRERVEVELSPRNPARFGAEDPVHLEVLVKNVQELVIKVFRVDALAYFLARGEEVDTSIDLDGMVASDERTLRLDAPPVQRTRQRIELPGCARPGTYVVELIGNGKSSRALVRKGALRHTVRVSAAGPTVRVYDDAGRPLHGARLWLGGREHAPRDDGEISVPFSTQPGMVPVLLVHGDVAQREILKHPSETYALAAGLLLERQTLVPGKTARVLLRPSLSVAGWPAPIALLEDPRVEITVTDLAGTATTRIEPVALRDDAEAVVSLRVPEDMVAIAMTLRGRVRVVSTQQTIDLADGASAQHNVVHKTDRTQIMYLATTDAGHVLHLRGLTGEPRAGHAVAFSFQHAAVTFAVQVTLATDERGRIELGPLPGVTSVLASAGTKQQWSLWPDVALPMRIHAEAGDEITLPAPPCPPEGDLLLRAVSLTEVRDGSPERDATDHVRLERGALVIARLAAGEYSLSARGFPDPVAIVVAPRAPAADEPGAFAVAGPRMLELSPPIPLCRGMSVDGDDLVVRVSDAGPSTRVHLFATLFRPDPALPSTLACAPRWPIACDTPPVLSHYVSGRDIGDEHRYVLERRRAARRPGVLLDKPSLLLDPWALRATSTAVQTAAAGTAYDASPPRGEPMYSNLVEGSTRGGLASLAAFATVDFLAEPAVVLDNLRPGEDGTVRVPRARLGAAQGVRAVVVDPALTSTADLALSEISPAPRDRRLRVALDPALHFTEERRVVAVMAGAEVVVNDVRTGKLELCDSVARAHQVLLTLGGDDTLREFAFVARWHELDPAARRAQYSKYACNELNLFLSVKDPEFFAGVVRPHLANRRYKTLVDRFLLGEDLAGYLEPWAFGRLNTLERVLLARRVPAVRDAVVRLVGDAVDLIPPDPQRDARLVDTLLGASALEEGGLAAVAGKAAGTAPELEYDAPAKSVASGFGGGGGFGPPPVVAGLGPPPGFGPPPASAAPMPPSAQKPSAKAKRRAGGGGADRDLADLRERSSAEALYRGADKTQEWAETGWWKKRIEEATPALVPPNRFWRDLAAHRDGPFLSPHLGECTTSFAESLCCLAFLDLPFAARKHDVAVDDVRLALTARSPALAARTRIVAVEEPAARGPILVGQSYFRADDRWEWDGAERRDKYVTGEMLPAVVYQCQVTVTNPTSAAQRLEVLLQIPRGGLPVSSGFLTRTRHLHLAPYGTEAIEYAFYFPAPGSWTHFGAHVTRAGALVAWAPPATLPVVREPTVVDAGSWSHVSQHGTTDEVLAFLAGCNLGRVDLARIAWRMRDRDAFTRVTALLAERLTYHDRLWAYGLAHADRARVAEWLRHQDAFVRTAGTVLEGALADLDPIARGTYQHLEYAPLVNARAHQLGQRRRILNDALDAQYRAFLDVVALRRRPGDDDLLTAAHYLFCLDRVDDALGALDRVRPEGVTASLQYAYLAAYAACCRGDLGSARRLATPWLDHPVDRWRLRFAALAAMLDEAEGVAGAAETASSAVDPDNRDQRMAELGARQPGLALSPEGGVLLLQHHNVAACKVRFHRMDLELLFSRRPFLQSDVERFSWIAAGHEIDLPLGEDGRTPVPIPEAMARDNLVVEAAAPSARALAVRYAHDLDVQLSHAYGQVRVLRASSRERLPATYVKVYARQRGGAVAFYKDGYTDLSGRFDYATLSTDDLDRVERFALLVASDQAGATVLEAPPPKR